MDIVEIKKAKKTLEDGVIVLVEKFNEITDTYIESLNVYAQTSQNISGKKDLIYYKIESKLDI